MKRLVNLFGLLFCCMAVIAFATAAVVTIDTSQGPVTLEIREVDPEPEPTWSPFPAGVGCWIYPGDDYADALVERGITWCQNWSMSYVPYLRPENIKHLPYMFEMQPEWFDKKVGEWKVKRSADRLDDANPKLENTVALLEYHASVPNFVAVNLSNETGHGPHTPVVREYIRGRFPHVKLFTGPFMLVLPDPGPWDGLVGFLNFTRYDRLPGDIYWCEAVANMHGLPWCISVQPVNATPADAPIYLANPEWFAEAVALAERRADGLNFWAIEKLLQVERGERLAENPERLPGLWAVIKNASLKPDPPRQRVMVYLADNWKEDRCVARVVGGAGFEAVGTLDPAAAEIGFADLEFTPEEVVTWARFNQCKYADARIGQAATEMRLSAIWRARLEE